MISDKNKNITSIKYNYLNLPTQISFGTGDYINYNYNAAGQKISKTVSSVNTNNMIKHVEYLDGFQYTGEELNFFPHAEGYVNVVLGTTGNRIFNYVYNYTDHLGNIRLSYTKDVVDNKLKIMEENHYYPFGLKHQKYYPETAVGIKAIDESTARPGYATSTPYNYKYNGQEWQDELGLNMYDMDMRQYDPAIARWVVMDPVIHHSMSPYNAFDNNPVFWADPSGADSNIFPDSMANFGEHQMIGNAENNAKHQGRTGQGEHSNNSIKKNAAIEIANKVEIAPGKHTGIEPKEWEDGSWKYMNVESIEDAVDKLRSYLNGNQLDNLLIMTHGGADGGMMVNINGDKITTGDLNMNNSHAQSILTLMSFVKSEGNVILGTCFTGQVDSFAQTLHQLSGSQHNVFINNDYSKFKFFRNSNSTIDRNIQGQITKRDDHRYGWDYIKANDSSSIVNNIKNIVISINGKQPVELKQ